MRAGAAALALLLAGCVAAPPQDRVSTLFLPDAGGLAVSGSALRVDFGRAPSGVIAPLSRELGPPRSLPLTGCPQGIERQLAWGDLVLTFTREQFVGWRQAGAAAGQICA
ncbi:hypothetical protein NHN26_00905 [Rhodovulum tesquicola]|uniref:hypothetical protein n=1 Tax=Rhodovulum tesquicola TaxID=540254 RepID=UPI0020978A6C|nr:hypothetical protein [Rhodovulum tesquicola]MCO8143770.1 hypothetical protein [Rhodovulum tesquicola]